MITIKNTVNAPIAKVWEYWNTPEHITKWSFASPDWHTPYAEADLREGGKFKSTMAAKDGSMSFDFGGIYTSVIPHKEIAYTMDDGRKVKITFTDMEGETKIEETFEPESENSEEMQRGGWQTILDNFKKYTEAN